MDAATATTTMQLLLPLLPAAAATYVWLITNTASPGRKKCKRALFKLKPALLLYTAHLFLAKKEEHMNDVITHVIYCCVAYMDDTAMVLNNAKNKALRNSESMMGNSGARNFDASNAMMEYGAYT